jgi:hypothetical protein
MTRTYRRRQAGLSEVEQCCDIAPKPTVRDTVTPSPGRKPRPESSSARNIRSTAALICRFAPEIVVVKAHRSARSARTHPPQHPSRRDRHAFTAGLLAALCLLSASGQASSQGYVRAPCQAAKAPAFEDALQPLWYRRFWTGECRDLSSLRCRRGKPYWNDVVRTLTARAPPAKRPEVATRACRLGRQIGLEWTRPSAKRRIDTQDLKALNATLEKAPDAMTGLAAVEARVRAKLKP